MLKFILKCLKEKGYITDRMLSRTGRVKIGRYYLGCGLIESPNNSVYFDFIDISELKYISDEIRKGLVK